MRLWTLHPRHLDARGLVALWREGLLAQAVLRGRTRGYRHHPQLERFRAHAAPRAAINAYLHAVLQEADRRGYAFDRSKVAAPRSRIRIAASAGQLAYERAHLLAKLRVRSAADYRRLKADGEPEAHPLFTVSDGPVASWEIRRTSPRANPPAPRSPRAPRSRRR